MNVYSVSRRSAPTRGMGIVWALVLLLSAGAWAQERGARGMITVAAGDTERINTPVSIALKDIGPGVTGGVLFERTEEGRRMVPTQVDATGEPQLCWIVSGKMAPGTERRYFFAERRPETEATGLELVLDDKALTVRSGDKNILSYYHAVMPPPEGQNPLYARSGFIHPFWSPSGAVLTRIHPADHIHHMGLWNPWTSARFEGQHVDFWNIGSGEGTVRFKEFKNQTEGPVFSRFTAIQEHVALKAKGGPKVALIEDFDIRVWNADPSGESGWLWDITEIQRCASDSPLELPAYRYGGLGFRGTAEWDRVGNYLTSEGKERKDGHGTRSRWCIVYGPTKQGLAGVTFMSHPQNHEHPEPMRIWDTDPKIFFNYAPTQKNDWIMEPGKEYVLRYRLHVFDGRHSPEMAERVWQDFAHPPSVTFEQRTRPGAEQ